MRRPNRGAVSAARAASAPNTSTEIWPPENAAAGAIPCPACLSGVFTGAGTLARARPSAEAATAEGSRATVWRVTVSRATVFRPIVWGASVRGATETEAKRRRSRFAPRFRVERRATPATPGVAR